MQYGVGGTMRRKAWRLRPRTPRQQTIVLPPRVREEYWEGFTFSWSPCHSSILWQGWIVAQEEYKDGRWILDVRKSGRPEKHAFTSYYRLMWWVYTHRDVLD